MHQEINRQELRGAKSRIEHLEVLKKRVDDNFAQKILGAKNDYQQKLTSLLGLNNQSSISLYAEEILQFADNYQLDPEWLGRELSSAFYDSLSYPSHKIKKPASETASSYYKYGISLLSMIKFRSDYSWMHAADQAFQKAEELSLIENPQSKISFVYKWLYENAGILGKLRSQKFWDNY